MADESKIGAELKALRNETKPKLTVRAVATALRIPHSTYSSKEDRYKKPLLPLDFVKSLIPIFEPRGIRPERLLRLAGVTGELSEASFQRPNKPNTIQVSVIGAIQAGVWREALEWAPDEQYTITVNIDPRYPIARYTGLEVRGTSMNKTYTEGTVLVCISAIEQRVEPESGENVIVRRRDQHGMFEYTVKELEIRDGRRLLWPRSDDPAYDKALEWHPSDVDAQDDLLVTGIVIKPV